MVSRYARSELAGRDQLAAAAESALAAQSSRQNAAQWAHEVEEYRPYAVDDTDFAKLRRELAKYSPAPGQLSGSGIGRRQSPPGSSPDRTKSSALCCCRRY